MSSLLLPAHWQINLPLLLGHLKKNAGGHLLKSAGAHLVNDCETLCCKDTIGINCTVSGVVSPKHLASATHYGTYPFYVWSLYRYDVWEYGDVNTTWYRALDMLDGGTKTGGNCYDGFSGNSLSTDVTDILIGDVTERHYSRIEAPLVHSTDEPAWTESDASGAYSYYLVEHAADLFLRFGPGLQFRMISKITSSTLTTVRTPAGSPTSSVLSVGSQDVVLGAVSPIGANYNAAGMCVAQDDYRYYDTLERHEGSLLCEWSPET